MQQAGGLRGVEGLRAVAACSILALHCWLTTRPDFSIAGITPLQLVANLLTTGVALFFALSGFLLYRPWAEAILGGGTPPNVRRYARHRLFRIAPAYLVILPCAAFLLGTTTAAQGLNGATIGPTDLRALLANATLTQNLLPGTAGTGIMPAWSLAVEVCYYLTLPVLGICAYRLAVAGWSRRTAAFGPPLLLFVTGVAGKLVAAEVVTGRYGLPASGWHYVLESSFLAHADEFSFGMVVAVLRHQVRLGAMFLPSLRARISAELAILAGIVSVFAVAPETKPYFAWTLSAALYAGLLAFVVIPVQPGRLVRVLELRPVAWAGMVSYSIFLWNQPVAFWLLAHGVVRPGLAWAAPNLLTVFAACLPLAWLTYRFVEAPAMRRRERPQPDPVVQVAVPVAARTGR